jgi:hypothetical protein
VHWPLPPPLPPLLPRHPHPPSQPGARSASGGNEGDLHRRSRHPPAGIRPPLPPDWRQQVTLNPPPPPPSRPPSLPPSIRTRVFVV